LRFDSRKAVLAAAVCLALLTSASAWAVLPKTSPDNTDMVNGQVRVLKQVNGDIWMGGNFDQVLDQSRNPIQAVGDLAAFGPGGGLDTSITLPTFANSAGPSFIYGLSLGPDGNLYVAGAFDSVNGQPRTNVAAIDPTTGALQSFAPAVTAVAWSVLATSSQIFVGTGKLLSFALNGSPTGGYTAPNAQMTPGIREHPIGPAFRDIVEYNGVLVSACQCDTVSDRHGTHPEKAVVKVHPATGDLFTWTPGALPTNSAAFGLSVIVRNFPGTKLPTVYLAAGGNDFVAAYGFVNGTQHWKEDVSGSAQAITGWQGNLIVGGHFDWSQTPTSAKCGDDIHPNTNCFHTPRLIALSASSGEVLKGGNGKPWNPGICCAYNGVWALFTDANGNSLHVGGDFKRVGGTWKLGAQKNHWNIVGAAFQDYYARLTLANPRYQLTAHIAGAGAGTITSNPGGIHCPGACSARFNGGAHVTLKAAAKAGSSFDGWGGGCSGLASTCTVTMSGARDVTANFISGSRCGKILFVSSRAGHGDIFAMNPNGSGVTNLTNNAAADGDPRWNPNCSKIAFSSKRGGAHWHLYVMDANGSGVRRLTNSKGNDQQPSWAPSGARLVFMSTRTGNQELFAVNANGSHTRQLTHNHWADSQPDWSPNGLKIVFASNGSGPTGLFTIRPDGSHRTRLFKNTKAASQPVWAPGGSRIAFVSLATGSAQVWWVNANGKGRKRLTKDGKTDLHPTWSPHGSSLAYASNRSGNAEIWTIRVNGTGAQNVSAATGSAESAPNWS
jgi:Tol biopolymer transport system component